MMNIAQVLEREEGCRESAYYCTSGYPTIGIGKRIGPKNAPLEMYDFTVSKSLAQAWLIDELIGIEQELYGLDWFINLNKDRKTIITSMAYQLGCNGLLKFKRMIAAIELEDWQGVAIEAIDSKWHKQTMERADRHIQVLLEGRLSDVY